MKFVSLVDTVSQTVITVDVDAITLRLEVDGGVRETRLKPFQAEILYQLCTKHPSPLLYDEICNILTSYGCVVSDPTRMHRKVSEIRVLLQSFYPGLRGMIANTRGIGYGLPLRFKNIYCLENKKTLSFKNAKIAKSIALIQDCIQEAIHRTADSNIIRIPQGFVIDRTLWLDILVEKINGFNKLSDDILREIRTHEADFFGIRIQYLLSKLRTYIGLARISEYPITKVQWLDWFEQEVWAIFDDLQKTIKSVEEF
jgi:hypothetical protein